jgi:hypothetical protein
VWFQAALYAETAGEGKEKFLAWHAAARLHSVPETVVKTRVLEIGDPLFQEGAAP